MNAAARFLHLPALAAILASGAFAHPPLTSPVPISPSGDASGLAGTVAFEWRTLQGAQWYQVELSPDSTFVSATLKSAMDTTVNAKGLWPTTRYFWRVCAGNLDGCGPWSAPRRFITALFKPATPSPISPVQYGTNQPLALSLSWSFVGPTQYQVQMASTQDFDFTRNLIDTVTSDTTLPVSGLSREDDYYWRLRAGNAAGWSSWSSPRRFSTTHAAIPSALGHVEASARSPIVTRDGIRFSLEHAAFVRITRLDPSGRARVLFGETLAPGTHRVALPSGLRQPALIRFEAGARSLLLPPQ